MDARSRSISGLAALAFALVGMATAPLVAPLAQGVWRQQQAPSPQQMPYGQQMPQQMYPAPGYTQQQPQQQQPGYPMQQGGAAQQPAGQPHQAQPMPSPQPPQAQPAPSQAVQPAVTQPLAQQSAHAPQPGMSPPAERVEADVSTRSVAITSSFTGTEIIIFGSVENSRQETAESGLYDIAIIIEGTPTPIVARKKSRVGGLWINTQSQTFDDVPSYYAIASTRPIEEITEPQILAANEIGFDYVSMIAKNGGKGVKAEEFGDFKHAVVRRKQAESLYQKSDYGVAFIGRSLFRSSISLPANVPVGPLVTRVYLFKDGKLLSKHSSKVNLQREGIERYLHDFAFDYPLLYGIFAVLVAVAAGLIASALFKKGSH